MADNKQDDMLDLDSILSEINTSIKKEVKKSKSSPKKSTAQAPSQKSEKKPTQKKSPTKKPAISEVFVETSKIIEESVEDNSDEINSILDEVHQSKTQPTFKLATPNEKPEHAQKETITEKIDNEIEKISKQVSLFEEKETSQEKKPPQNNKQNKNNQNKNVAKAEENNPQHFIQVTAVVDDEPIKSIAEQKAEIEAKKIADVSKDKQKDKSEFFSRENKSHINVSDEVDISPSPLSPDKPIVPKEQPAKEVSRENNPHIKKLRDKKLKPKMTRRQKNTAILGAIMTLFFVVGIIATIFSGISFSKDIINQTALKDELSETIFPFVIIDVPEFESPDKLDNSAIISSAIWEFIIDKTDKSGYVKEELGSIFVPALDIEHYIRKLYGNDVKIKHQTVDDPNIMMMYDEKTQLYNIESTPKVLPYKPRVDKIKRSGDIYTLSVSYILPNAVWSLDTKKKNEQIDKVMQYTLKKSKEGYKVLSVKLISVGSGSSLSQEPDDDLGLTSDIDELLPDTGDENQLSSATPTEGADELDATASTAPAN